jgi:AhpD family alkylhydroperoxidase
MVKDYKARLAEVDEYALRLKELVPTAMSAFGQLAREAQVPNALDRKTKELIALSIGVKAQCDACIGYHARGALRAGATRQEVAEAVMVAIQMGGGPAINYAADALRAFDQFAEHEPKAAAAE